MNPYTSNSITGMCSISVLVVYHKCLFAALHVRTYCSTVAALSTFAASVWIFIWTLGYNFVWFVIFFGNLGGYFQYRSNSILSFIGRLVCRSDHKVRRSHNIFQPHIHLASCMNATKSNHQETLSSVYYSISRAA